MMSHRLPFWSNGVQLGESEAGTWKEHWETKSPAPIPAKKKPANLLACGLHRHFETSFQKALAIEDDERRSRTTNKLLADLHCS